MYTIHLSKLRFHARHGVHPEEEKTGGEFEVNIRLNVELDSPKENLSLADTVDYTEVYRLTQELMLEREYLLENLARRLAGKILDRFRLVSEVGVTVTKLSPPITRFEGSIGVEISLKREL